MDIVRIISLPILFLNPSIFVTVYIVYFIIELWLWNKLKRKDSFWIVCVFPLYGLVNSITRFASYAAYLYRYIVFRLLEDNHERRRDDYRTNKPYKIQLLISFVVVIEIMIIFLFVITDFLDIIEI